MPISRAEHNLALKNIAEIIEGLELDSEQNNQMINNLIKENEQFRLQIVALTNGKNPASNQKSNGNGVNKSYA